MQNSKRIGINMIAQIVSFILNLGINMVLTPYVTEHIGKEVYGFVNLAFQATSYVTVVTTALNAMLGRYVTVKLSQKDYESANKYFTSVTIANAVIALLMVIPSALIIIFMQYVINVPTEYIVDVRILWAFIFANFLLGLATECFGVSTYAVNRLDLSAKRSMESNIIKVVILYSLYALFAPKVWYIGVSTFVCGFFVIATNIYYTRKYTPTIKVARKYFDWKAVWELVAIGTWNSINQLAQMLINGLDMLLTNWFIGATEMTLMGFAKSVPTYILSLIGIVSSSFGPQMTITYAKGNMDEFVKQTNSAIKICGFLCSVPVIGFIAFGTNFFTLWLPTLSTAEIKMVQILSVLTLLQTVFDVYIYPLYTVNSITCKLKIPVLVNIGIGVLNVIGTLILLETTDLGIYSIQIVSSTLLFLRVFFFAPLYAAHILDRKWYTFYPILIRGMLSTGIILLIYTQITMHYRAQSWFSFAITVVIAGFIGYVINFIIVLDKKERVMLKEKITSKFK